MKKVLLLLSVMCWFTGASGQDYHQVSGYLGKRLVVGGGINCSPSYQPQHINSTEGIGLNMAYRITAEYAKQHYLSIGIKAERIRTSLDFRDRKYKSPIYWADNSGYYELKSTEGRPDIQAVALGVYFKFFRKRTGAMAPVGKYLALGLDMYRINADHSNVIFTTFTYDDYGDKEDVRFKLKNPNLKEVSPVLYLAIGNVIPLGRSFNLDYNLNSGIFVTGLKSNESFSNNSEDLQRYAFIEVDYRMLNVFAFNFSMKLNFML